VFIPAVNRAGPDGWDMVKVATDIKLNAQAQGNEVSTQYTQGGHQLEAQTHTPVCMRSHSHTYASRRHWGGTDTAVGTGAQVHRQPQPHLHRQVASV
jgi:hypothetical protein